MGKPIVRRRLLIGVAVGIGHFAVSLLLLSVVVGAAMGGSDPGVARLLLMTIGLPLMPFEPWAAMHGRAMQLVLANSAMWGGGGALFGPRLWSILRGGR